MGRATHHGPHQGGEFCVQRAEPDQPPGPGDHLPRQHHRQQGVRPLRQLDPRLRGARAQRRHAQHGRRGQDAGLGPQVGWDWSGGVT